MLVLAAVIHALFCIQVFMALPGGMALTGFGLLLFYPHYMLMFFLPPAYPIHDNGIVDYGELWGKLVVAFPASLVYGIIIVAILAFIRQILSRPKHDA
ncbi:MAG: hypothetical protein ACREFE_20575 [Limisphaerales bacterium]